jgi:hypothetical protein
MASLRYIVVATLARVRLGARLNRGSMEDASDHVESRRSPGIKKCCSRVGVDMAELVVVAPGRDGTGGTIGDSGGDRTVTPGI